MAAVQPKPTEHAREPLTRERVLRAAVDLADASGIDSLSMRRLAQELGVEAMSLYHHVRNKDDLLDGIVGLVTDEFELPTPGGDWKAEIHRTATSAYDTLISHPWAAGLSLSVKTVSPARMRYMDAILGTFREAGFTAGMTDHAYHALESHIMGFTLWEVGMNLGTAEDLRRFAGEFLATFPAEEYPHMAEHIGQHMKPRPAGDPNEFEFGLGLILDGLERSLKRRTVGR
jgi:AcrR family transcriptional regulator